MKNTEVDRYVFGIYVLGIVLIIISVVELRFLKNYEYYAFLHQYLPPAIIPWRYTVSLGFRFLTLACGLGLLFRWEVSRRCLILVSIVTIATIYWRHPVQCFVYIFDHVALRDPARVISLRQDIPHIEWILTGINYVIDVTLAGIYIFFFTRPRVKERFRSSGHLKNKFDRFLSR
ncbi:MAG: hypothetical protein JXD21_00875 [Candidatus Omnitrophica bacterium]|nr:hypothetical protein [Candidatus Omnitrophota bacterium]